MAASLIITNNNAANPLTQDLSTYLDLTESSTMDPQNPAFSNRVISHSLLKEGGVLALEDLQAKELIFPVKLNATTSSGLATLIQKIQNIVHTPGATFSWQDDGMSQPTVFDGISGEFVIHYSYRQASAPAHWATGEVRLFTQPLGHTAAARSFASASSVGPLLMISPYASGGAGILHASNVGFGTNLNAGPLGASSGISYFGSPSLVGDAPAQLQISYAGPFAPGGAPQFPTCVISLLPDSHYTPLVTVPEMSTTVTPTIINDKTVVASQYMTFKASTTSQNRSIFFSPPYQAGVTVQTAGLQRIFAIARASQCSATLALNAGAFGPVVNASATVVNNAAWALYDLGLITLRASQGAPLSLIDPGVSALVAPQAGAGALDVNALIMVPDSSSWFFNGASAIVNLTNNNVILSDDVLGNDVVTYDSSQGGTAPNPAIMYGLSNQTITIYARGTRPRPEPGNGPPILAILGMPTVGQPSSVPRLPVSAQVNVLERTRYILG